ncbi:ATP-grasp domain-containing protein [bacterium]|nr:ATP-grasp domain-containing protein [bacterium]
MRKYDNKLIMVIGAGLFQSVAIKQAKELGLKVLATDFDPQACGFKLADYQGIVSTRDIEATTSFAVKFNKKHKIDGVLTIGTDVSCAVAGVAEALGLVGVSPETAVKATNKARMRECFWKNAVPAPKWREVFSLEQAEKAVRELGLPVVCKPVDNMGARGVRKVEKIDDLKFAFENSLRNSCVDAVVVEEYMHGAELSIDTLVYKGEVHLLTIADRHIEREPYFVEVGHTVPSMISEDVKQQVFEVMKQGIKAVGIENGASKADMKLTEDGPKIGEITARLSGGYHSQFTDPLSTGMNSIKAAIDIALGFELDLSDITPVRNYTACERAIIPVPGRIIDIKGLDEAKKIPGFEKIFLHLNIGDSVEPVISNMGKAANFICTGKTRKQAVSCADKILDTIKIVTEANCSAVV